MSDNRTTEPTAINRIISTLRERDVQFATHGNTDRVWWTTENGVTWYAQDRPNANDLFVKLEAVLTPEQAIAATLGNSRVDYHGYEQAAIEAWESIKAWNSRAERTCELHDCAGSFSAVNKPVWRCDCGAFMTQYTDATTYHKPRFCPNCGRKVIGG